MDPQLRRRRTLDAAKRLLVRESVRQPLIIMLEDLHWIDGESEAVLNLLADSIAMAPILMLVNYRPEYRHEWSNKSNYTQLRINTLGVESAEEVLSALLGDGKDLNALKRMIIEKAEGNPFFIEEMVQALFEQGVLARNGTVKIVKSMNQVRLSATVHDVLASRIDRLPPDEKELLQTLAVIGAEFPVTLAAAVTGKSEEDLQRMFANLQLAEFVYERLALPDVEYIFKHALTQEVAYNSVLNERRRVLHERVGGALELIYTESLDDHLAELAHHYARSGNPSKAVEYCLRAVRQCDYRGSFVEAVAHFESGLEQVLKLPDDDRRAELELDLRNAVGWALMATKGWGSLEAAQSAVRTIVLCQRPGINWEKTWTALNRAFIVNLTHPDVRKAGEIAAQLIARAEANGGAECIAGAARAMATVRMNSGDFELAAQGFDRAMALWEFLTKTGLTQQRATLVPQALGMGSHDNNLSQSAWNLSHSAWNLWFLGYPDRALERMNIATAGARESGSKEVLVDVHLHAARVFELRRELERMRERAETMLLLSTESGEIARLAMSETLLGWADAMSGDLDGGIARMRLQMLELKAAGSEFSKEYHLALIATALGRMGRFDEGLRTIDESFPIIERTGARWYEAEVHRLKGELLLAQDASSAARAEQSFRTAIEISRRQHAKSWELRAMMSLARLLRETRRRDEARTRLAEIYGWFSEGFDTADLKAAKALLDELNA